MDSLKFLEVRQILSHSYIRCFQPLLEKTGLNRMEMKVLLFLANNPAYDTAADVVKLRGLTKSHVSAAITGLQDKGLVLRATDGKDRKKLHLKLTDAAMDVVAEGQRTQREFAQKLIRGIDAERLRAMSEGFDQMVRNVSE